MEFLGIMSLPVLAFAAGYAGAAFLDWIAGLFERGNR